MAQVDAAERSRSTVFLETRQSGPAREHLHRRRLPQNVLRHCANALRNSRIRTDGLDTPRPYDVEARLRALWRTQASQRYVGITTSHRDANAVLCAWHPRIAWGTGHQRVATDEKQLETLLRNSESGDL